MMSFEEPRVTVGSSMSDEDLKSNLDHRRCTRRNCKGKAKSDSDYCIKHEEDIRRYDREYKRRRYAERDDAGVCTRCGGRDRKMGLKICPACAISLNRLNRDLQQNLDHRKDRVSKRLIPWTNSPHNAGRHRMRGGKRGAPSAEARDRRDLADIKRVLDRYMLSLDECYSAETKAMNKIAREDAIKAAHSGLALAVRMGMEALVTYGYDCPALAEDFDPDGDGIDHDLAVQAREIAKSGR